MVERYIAKTFYGLEEILAREIRHLGGQNIQVLNRAVSFEGDLAVLYKVNLHARTALRVLKPFLQFTAHNETVLYKRLRRFDWWKLMTTAQTFVIDSTVHSKFFTHSRYVSLKMKDAIVDQFRDRSKGRRPSVELDNPDFRFNIHCRDKEFTISLDSSGESLHKRGYRLPGRRAPLNEALAAGMVLLSEWSPDQILYDPMCGSGTILAEALLIAQKKAPRLNKKHFAFMKWANYDPKLWEKIKGHAEALVISPTCRLVGSDIDNSCVHDTNDLLRSLGYGSNQNFQADFFVTSPPGPEGLIIVNPPYGERVKLEDAEGLYKSIGDTLKSKYSGWKAWVLSGNKEALKKLGLRTSRRFTLYNGAIECKYHCYDLYEGSRKTS